MSLDEVFSIVARWSNENQGLLSVAIFLITIALGWASGIFSALRRRPNFRITIIPGPTFCCTYLVGRKHATYDVHRTGIALYLKISNIGSAPSSIENISIGYHWHLKPFSIAWLKYTLGWFWLNHQAVVLADFQTKIGENVKVYPFLTQKNFLSKSEAETYLKVGCELLSNVVYAPCDQAVIL